MRIEVDIKKSYFISILVVVLLLGAIGGAYAVWDANKNVYHNSDDVKVNVNGQDYSLQEVVNGGLIEGGITSTRVFDTAGTYTWTVPQNVNKIFVEVVGGGGSGGCALGSGGGSGGYSAAHYSVSSGQQLSVVVGAKGAPCSTNTPVSISGQGNIYDGLPGGQSKVSVSSSTIALANGGLGGLGTVNAFLSNGQRFTSTTSVITGGAGGAIGTGDIKVAGNKAKDIQQGTTTCRIVDYLSTDSSLGGEPVSNIVPSSNGRGGPGAKCEGPQTTLDNVNGLVIISYIA